MPVAINHRGLTANFDEVGGLLVATLEDAYNAVRKIHKEIPPAVIVISSSPPRRNRQVWGHFAHSRWDVNGTRLPEIMISAEGLKRTPREVMATVVHEAAHGLCYVRGIEDTSNRGRYHNEKFKLTAEELGLKIEKVPILGYSGTTLPEGVYDEIVQDISSDLIAYRETDVVHSQSRGPRNRTEHPYKCACRPARTIRVHEGVFDAGAILCGVCGDEFL